MKKVLHIFLAVVVIMALVAMPAFAHSGNTDRYGGHHDYKNVSGLGSYHYHHGHGPHLHPNGICPYGDYAKWLANHGMSSSSSSYSSSTKSKSSSSSSSYATKNINITVKLNGKVMYVSPKPYLSLQTVMVPLRSIAQNLGCTVHYNGSSVIVSCKRGVVTLYPGTRYIRVNGVQQTLASAIVTKNNYIMVPLRTLATALGASVQYANNTVSIYY